LDELYSHIQSDDALLVKDGVMQTSPKMSLIGQSRLWRGVGASFRPNVTQAPYNLALAIGALDAL
jgi:hypothetical protein